MNDPVDSIAWLEASSLRANGYNPNVVHYQELALLEFSLLKTGWIQPILINRDRLIIDGFHRWSLALRSAKLIERYAGKVPVATLDISDAEAMLTTIRINRAKGTHVAIRMSEIVHSLVKDHGYEPSQISQNIGAGPGEIDLLLQDGIFEAKNLAHMPYSRSWTPRHPSDKSP